MLQALVLTVALLASVLAGESVTFAVRRWMRRRGRRV
jgi:hypothetical protein